jgi:hypothetical protein
MVCEMVLEESIQISCDWSVNLSDSFTGDNR